MLTLLVMVWFVLDYGACAIQLFGENESHHLM